MALPPAGDDRAAVVTGASTGTRRAQPFLPRTH
jgi:hypothetical protein